MIKDVKENLELIQNTIYDTKYVLDDASPNKGIKKVLSQWLFSFFIVNLLSFLIVQISLKTHFWGTEIYYSMYRIFNILSLLIPVMIYFLFLKKINMTIKERDFLQSFSIYITLLSLIKMYPALSYYINTDIMLLLYDTIPLDLLVIFLAIFQIYRYFHNKSLIYLNIILLVYMMFFIFIKSIAFNITEINLLVSHLMSLIDYLNMFSVVSVFVFALIIFLLRNYEKKYS